MRGCSSRWVFLALGIAVLLAPRPASAQVGGPLSSAELGALRQRSATNPKRTVNRNLLALFGLETRDVVVSGKGLNGPGDDGPYYIRFLDRPGADDIVMMDDSSPVTRLFLTDSSLVLRAAAIQDSAGLRLVTNEQADSSYRATLKGLSETAKRLK